MKAEKQIAQIMTKRQKTIAVAESCTGGLLSDFLTNIPGSSKFFYLGITAYNNKFKTSLLRVPSGTLTTKGAVSKETATAMSKNIRAIAGTSLGLSITGIAGPAGASKTKPVGLVYISLSSQSKNICKRFLFKGNRISIKKQAAYAALNLLLAEIKQSV
ncbi:MAG: competence protein ComA [Candidatus Omnitrophica bacterium CG11_big_fil_rev_8_21_14_0_20_42_13]|uniref:Competence protein ComA n=1 Tax=Candidatus Ghiorseimicrobium undicola TaxID=1974746 RepID=A0A2H0LZB9_9BACT|nr:MAG: competence protein ComA [Candidatus Omnitrophica bacterium CG11_big_fil_rev_8_21_14_0_20_42_13]